MKFFSLISNKQVHNKEGEKIISSKDFSILKTSNAILKTVKKEAANYKKTVVKESEEIKKLASEDGFQEGLEKFNKLILHLEKKLKTVEKEIQEKLLPIALQAAKKILSEELRLHPDRIVDIVKQSLKPVIQHHNITIYANKDDLASLKKGRSEIKKILDNVKHLSIQEGLDIKPGGCVIKTEAGIINAQLENQWRAIETAFESFMKK